MRRILLILFTFFSLSFAGKVFVIDVEGMTCKMCPIAVKKVISQVEGVRWVNVYLKNNVAVVVTEDRVNERDILEAIPKAGSYKGKLIGKYKF